MCFSESARKMTENGGRVVPVWSIRDIYILWTWEDKKEVAHRIYRIADSVSIDYLNNLFNGFIMIADPSYLT